jgi:hypothetical protein
MLLLILLSLRGMSQSDSSSRFSVSFNLFNNFFNQHTIEIDYRINQDYSIGIGGGIIKSNPWWRDYIYYNGTDDKYPYGYYNGWMLMTNFKELNLTKSHWFFEPSFFYKYLYYEHVHFTNSGGDPNPKYEWERSEVANVYGIKLLIGKRYIITKFLALETVFGVSGRLQHREYFTFWFKYLEGGKWGLDEKYFAYPGIQAGLMLVFGNFKTK